MLFRSTGARKTTTAAHLLRREAWKLGKSPTFKNVAELFLELRESIQNHNERNCIKKFQTAEILLLDDLASEKISDYSVTSIYLILNHRGERNLPTIITSNLTLEEIGTRIDDRVANRLKRYGPVYKL